ncbi:hypothetical protein TA3x_000806 [Tundrisphaera sp. TA3]|uniref:hypothetical protein n=1 Tax=Tundrisphaera sp. TA3 TaxID=3435775 RepID=UPI003EBF7EF2
MTPETMTPDNPYAAPSSMAPARSGSRPSLELFLFWEKLRVAYNAILVAEVLILAGMGMSASLWKPEVIVLAFAANVCFSTAPVVHAYAILIGLPSRAVGWLLFIVGTTLSTILTAEALRDLSWWKMV